MIKVSRTPSGHDIPIPESVFVGMASLEQAIRTQGQQAQVWQANHDSEHKALGEKLEQAIASKRHDWTKIIGAIAAAIPLIIGGVRATTPAPERPSFQVIPSPIDPRMATCSSIQPGTQAQAECFGRVQAEIQSGKLPPLPR